MFVLCCGRGDFRKEKSSAWSYEKDVSRTVIYKNRYVRSGTPEKTLIS